MTFFPKEESLKMSNCVMYVVFTCFGNTSDKEDAMKYQLTDLIAIEFLQKLVDLCHEFTGMATGILDADGVPLVCSGWQPICTDFHRQCPQTKLRCQTSDKYLNSLASEAKYVSRRCLNGLMHYAARIEVDHHHLGSFVISQVFHSPPDRHRFVQQARKYGFEEDSYLKALDQVKIISPADMKRNLQLLMDLTQLLVQMMIERKQNIAAQEASITSDKYLNLVVESSQDGFWLWEKGDIFTMSDRCAEIVSFSSEDFRPLPQAWLDRIHPQDFASVIRQLEDHMAGRLPNFSAEYRFLTRSGQWKWLLANAQIISRDREHRPTQIAGTISDITERKQIEMDLLERESLYRSLVETSPCAIALTDLSGIVKFINPQGADLFGWDAARLIGQSGHILLHATEWGRLGQDFRSVLISGHPKQAEYTCAHRNGKTFIAEIHIAPIYDANRHLSGCICTAQDITTRKMMETELLQHRNHLEKLVEENIQALRISEERFAKAFTASPIAMSIATLEEGRYVEVNDAFCHLMGYAREEILGKLSRIIWHKTQDRDVFKQMIEEHFLVKDHEFQFVTRSGEVRIGLLSGQHIQIGAETFILSSISDITEKRRIDREISRLDRLNLIGEMAASIGHEIRNPMTTVRGLLQMLGSEALYQRDQDLFDLMIEELDRANSILSEFLSLAKDKHVDLLPSNLATIISSVTPLIKANAMPKDISVVFQMDPVPDLLLDSKEIRQLVFNLTQNGLEAMQPGGTLILRTYEDNGEVVLLVQDEGPGIEESILDKLGMPFVTSKEKGTGLGLSVCYRIAARHNATIEVKTGSQGTTFFVRFSLTNKM